MNILITKDSYDTKNDINGIISIFELSKIENIASTKSLIIKAILSYYYTRKITKKIKRVTFRYRTIINNISSETEDFIIKVFEKEGFDEMKKFKKEIEILEKEKINYMNKEDNEKILDSLKNLNRVMADLIMILNQCFNKSVEIESNVPDVDISIFDNFSFN